MIVSFLHGRVRVRSVLLKNKVTLQHAVDACAALDGFISASHNYLTGSLLLQYKTEALPKGADTPQGLHNYFKKRATALSCFFIPQAKSGKLFNRMMAAAFTVCIFSSAFGMLRLHKYSAFLLTALLAKHMFDYKKQIF